MIHQLSILAISEHGYVGKCQCCEHYNLVFHNQMFVFEKEDLKCFSRMIKTGDSLFEAGDICRNGRTIAMRTPIKNFYLMFFPTELIMITNMLDEAFLMMEVNEVLQF